MLGTECGNVGPLGHVCALPDGHAFSGLGETHYAAGGRVGWLDGPEPRAMVFLLDPELFAELASQR